MNITKLDSPTGLRARLLGPVEIAVDGTPVPHEAWPRRNARLLLMLLLATPGHRIARDVVLEALWPSASLEAATNSLYVAIHTLRRVLEPEVRSGRSSRFVDVTGDAIRLVPGAVSWVDVTAFTAALDAREGDRRENLVTALALYTGEFLGDDLYLDWAAVRREHLRWRWREAVLEYAALERNAGRPLLAVPALERVLQVDPTDEPAFRALMTAYVDAGRREDAIRQFERCTTLLHQELGVQPSEETLALAKEIREASVIRTDFARPSIHIANLPVPPNPLVGRGREIEELLDLLLQPRVRLVTISGTGGVGKTRLAIEAASLARDEFADDACFVGLAQVRDPDLVMPSVARALDLDDASDEPPLARLRDRLRDSNLLLVVDNFEQVLDAASGIADLLAACPKLTILTTSREPLHLRAEHDFPLNPLPVPKVTGIVTAGHVGRSSSIELFVQRARAVRHGFLLSDVNAAAVGQLCAQLDGLPLAIELAAARVRHQEPHELVVGLTDRFGLLANGYRDLPTRQRTMRATITWSYDLLSDAEQLLFGWLAIFTGGFTTDAAIHTGRQASNAFTERQVSDMIASLKAKGLLHDSGTRHHSRYGMYETVREFALETLINRNTYGAAAYAHTRWFLNLAERAASQLTGPDQTHWLDILDTELDNLRAALAYLLDDPSGRDDALRLSAALWRFWWSRGYAREGRTWLERVLGMPGSCSAELLARALYAAGELAEALADYQQATIWYEEALLLHQSLDDEAGRAEILNGLGIVVRAQGDLNRAEALHEQALIILQRVGDRRGVAGALNNLGAVAYFRGEIGQAEHYWNAALAVVRKLGDDRAIVALIGNLGALALMRQDAQLAVALHEEGLSLARRIGDAFGITQALANLGGALLASDDAAGAAEVFEEALLRCRESGNIATEAVILFDLGRLAEREHDLAAAANRYAVSLTLFHDAHNLPGVASTLERIGALAAVAGAPTQAARFLGAASAMWQTTGAARNTVDHGEYERDREKLEAGMGEVAFGMAWSEGLQLMPAKVVAEAVAFLTSAQDYARSGSLTEHGERFM
ncbi:MAG: tetratricopeptide repeat protein [Chloroflexia bacterium]|nr:tetratricopeptide repeat protein [Chloroflexia bacterium]